jgi:hypothetical protein
MKTELRILHLEDNRLDVELVLVESKEDFAAQLEYYWRGMN